jgi:hypothetical protein
LVLDPWVPPPVLLPPPVLPLPPVLLPPLLLPPLAPPLVDPLELEVGIGLGSGPPQPNMTKHATKPIERRIASPLVISFSRAPPNATVLRDSANHLRSGAKAL